ncbi:MAG: hypothetical protein V4466_10585 [Pseudomonadota bacterium]
MFEFGRELRRLLAGEPPSGVFQDGLAGGDPALLELLDLRLLTNEARSADIAGGRIGSRDRPAGLLQAAITWRELARRSGDATALRKAASAAEAATRAFKDIHRQGGVARARAEQGLCALLGADLFGDEGLTAAAERVLTEAAASSGVGAAMASAALAGMRGRSAAVHGDAEAVSAAAAAFEAPLAALSASSRASGAARLALSEYRTVRADMLVLAGARLRDRDLVEHGVREAHAALDGLDAAYEPLSYARAAAACGVAQAALAEVTGDVEPAADGVDALAAAVEHASRDHSPMDWATIQTQLGHALLTLGEATDSPRAFEQAVTCFERAGAVLKDQSALALRARVAAGRAQALGRQAELTGDIAVLDVAVAALKTELCAMRPAADPVAWAVTQLNLARLYEVRVEITGRDDHGALASAATALAAAFDVFAEQGMRTLTDLAHQGLERLRVKSGVA